MLKAKNRIKKKANTHACMHAQTHKYILMIEMGREGCNEGHSKIDAYMGVRRILE